MKLSKTTLEQAMRTRAFELRCMTGRGWTREQLMTDDEWKELHDKKESLTNKQQTK